MAGFRESIFNAVDREYSKVYDNAKSIVRTVIEEFLQSCDTRFSGTSAEEYTEWLKKLMYGYKWNKVVNRISRLLHRADLDAMAIINKSLSKAFTDGANAYSMLIEQQLDDGTKMLPFTEKFVLAMVSKKKIDLHNKKINQEKDITWCRTKVNGSKLMAALGGIKVKELSEYIADRSVNNTKRSVDVIARAMVFGAINYGAYEAGRRATEMGIPIEKTWLAIMDMNVRDSHKELNGTTIPLNGLFHSFHGPIRFPHDPDAAMEEVCGCRCSLAIHVKGKAPRYSKRRLLSDQVGDYRKWAAERIEELGGEVKLLEAHARLAGW